MDMCGRDLLERVAPPSVARHERHRAATTWRELAKRGTGELAGHDRTWGTDFAGYPAPHYRPRSRVQISPVPVPNRYLTGTAYPLPGTTMAGLETFLLHSQVELETELPWW